MRSQYPLAGFNPGSGKEFEKPYRGRGREEMDSTNYSARLGDLCEKSSIGVWTGNIDPEDDVRAELGKHRQEIVKLVRPGYTNTVTKVQDMNLIIAGGLKETWQNYAELLTLTDYVFSTNLYTEMNDLIEERPLNKDKFRYLFQTTLVLTGELLHPTYSVEPKKYSMNGHIALPIRGKLIPNVTYSINSIYAGQFDALVVPNNAGLDADNFNYLEYLESAQQWEVIEIKTPYRPRRFTGDWRRTSPYNQDLDQFNHRLGELIVHWYGNPNRPSIPMPGAVTFCYLRGVLPTATVRVNTKELSYLQEWQRRISYAIHQAVPERETEQREEDCMELNNETGLLSVSLLALIQDAQNEIDARLNNSADTNNAAERGSMVDFEGKYFEPVSAKKKTHGGRKKTSKKLLKPQEKMF